MKRYDFTSDDMCHSGCRIEEFKDGNYVRYEDVKDILVLEPPDNVNPECNCKESAKIAHARMTELERAGFETMSDSWFCPAHGYKKL